MDSLLLSLITSFNGLSLEINKQVSKPYIVQCHRSNVSVSSQIFVDACVCVSAALCCAFVIFYVTKIASMAVDR